MNDLAWNWETTRLPASSQVVHYEISKSCFSDSRRHLAGAVRAELAGDGFYHPEICVLDGGFDRFACLGYQIAEELISAENVFVQLPAERTRKLGQDV